MSRMTRRDLMKLGMVLPAISLAGEIPLAGETQDQAPTPQNSVSTDRLVEFRSLDDDGPMSVTSRVYQMRFLGTDTGRATRVAVVMDHIGPVESLSDGLEGIHVQERYRITPMKKTSIYNRWFPGTVCYRSCEYFDATIDQFWAYYLPDKPECCRLFVGGSLLDVGGDWDTCLTKGQ